MQELSNTMEGNINSNQNISGNLILLSKKYESAKNLKDDYMDNDYNIE